MTNLLPYDYGLPLAEAMPGRRLAFAGLQHANDTSALARYTLSVQATAFDEEGLFATLARSAVRILLIGRRALVALGIPVLTVDYDFWLHIDDIEVLNTAVEPLDLFPIWPPADARKRGRYVLEGDERIDVLVARHATTKDGVVLRFDDAWARRLSIPYTEQVTLAVPCVDDLILTKRWSLRPKDVEDIELLDKLRGGRTIP